MIARGTLYHWPGLGHGSSEQAEWLALLHALAVARMLGERDVVLLGDAAGVINQAVRRARCRSPELRACLDQFGRSARHFDRVRVRHIRRSQNHAGIALGKIRERARIGWPQAATIGIGP